MERADKMTREKGGFRYERLSENTREIKSYVSVVGNFGNLLRRGREK